MMIQVRSWRTGKLYDISRIAGGPVFIRQHFISDNFADSPVGIWDYSMMTDEDMEAFKARFISEHRGGGYHHRTMILADAADYTFKTEREKREAAELVAKMFEVPTPLIWGGGRGNGKASKSQEIAKRMRQLSSDGKVWWASRTGTFEEFLAKQEVQPPSKPKLDRRKKKRR